MARLSKDERAAVALFKQHIHRVLPGRVSTVQLFGSKARGESTAESDVDVLVILEAQFGWEEERAVIDSASDVLVATGILISPKVYSAHQIEEMRRRHSLFWQSISHDLVSL